MTSTENMKLWYAVCESDPKHLKHVGVRGGYTSIDPQYQLLLATQQWGPYGKDWGLRNLDHKTVFDKDVPVMVILSGEFYYPDGAFPYVVNASFDARDPDMIKKALTDMQSKCLSKLGFNADVFMNMWDKDTLYRAHSSPPQKKPADVAPVVKKAPAKDIFTADIATLSRAQMKKRAGAYRDKMFDMEREKFNTLYDDADIAGLAGLVTSIENRIAKDGA